MGYYESEPLIYKRFVKENKCKCTNGMLENGLKYLYCDFLFDVVNASTSLEI